MLRFPSAFFLVESPQDPVRATDGVDSWWGGSGSKRKRHEGDEQLEKQELDELIKRHGGKWVNTV